MKRRNFLKIAASAVVGVFFMMASCATSQKPHRMATAEDFRNHTILCYKTYFLHPASIFLITIIRRQGTMYEQDFVMCVPSGFYCDSIPPTSTPFTDALNDLDKNTILDKFYEKLQQNSTMATEIEVKNTSCSNWKVMTMRISYPVNSMMSQKKR